MPKTEIHTGCVPDMKETVPVMLDQLVSEVGTPTINKLSPGSIRLGKLFRYAAWSLEKAGVDANEVRKFMVEHLKAYRQDHLNDLKSSWAFYCLLNLCSHLDDIHLQPDSINLQTDLVSMLQQMEDLHSRVPSQAVRFSHTSFAHGTIEGLHPDYIARTIQNVFTNSTLWQNGAEGSVIIDPRIKSILQKPPLIITLNELEQNNLMIKGLEDPHQPVVLYLDTTPIGNAYYSISALVTHLLPFSPYIMVVSNSEEYGIITSQMITNHRFFDGVPAAFYTRKVAEALGLQNIEPSSLSRSTLETLLNHADEIENFPATDDSYISKSVLLSKDLSSQLYSIYLEITEQFPSNDYIKFEQFLQIFLLAAYGVNGDDVVGGVLRFIPKLSVQLDHFAVGNIQEVLRALITGNRNYLQNNEYENDNNEFGLFRPTWSNIEGIVTKFKIFPPQSWQLFNRLSKKLRIADAVAGQLMCSLIPKSINIYGESVPLSGIGGPALTEYQDAAFTIYADTAVQPPVIVVRRKFKQELKKAA